MIWLTSIETSESVGIPPERIVMIERKSAKDGHAVAIFLENGKEVRVMEPLSAVRAQLEGEKPEEDKGFT